MTAKMLFDPLGLVLEIFNEMHPDKECVIYWRQGMKADAECFGCTDFEASPIAVSIDVGLPLEGAVEVLAHELAHVAVGFVKPQHGKKWQKAFDAIHAAYSERVDALEAVA